MIGEELGGLPRRRQRRSIAEKIGLIALANHEARKSHGLMTPHEFLPQPGIALPCLRFKLLLLIVSVELTAN